MDTAWTLNGHSLDTAWRPPPAQAGSSIASVPMDLLEEIAQLALNNDAQQFGGYGAITPTPTPPPRSQSSSSLQAHRAALLARAA